MVSISSSKRQSVSAQLEHRPSRLKNIGMWPAAGIINFFILGNYTGQQQPPAISNLNNPFLNVSKYINKDIK